MVYVLYRRHFAGSFAPSLYIYIYYINNKHILIIDYYGRVYNLHICETKCEDVLNFNFIQF